MFLLLALIPIGNSYYCLPKRIDSLQLILKHHQLVVSNKSVLFKQEHEWKKGNNKSNKHI